MKVKHQVIFATNDPEANPLPVWAEDANEFKMNTSMKDGIYKYRFYSDKPFQVTALNDLGDTFVMLSY